MCVCVCVYIFWWVFESREKKWRCYCWRCSNTRYVLEWEKLCFQFSHHALSRRIAHTKIITFREIEATDRNSISHPRCYHHAPFHRASSLHLPRIVFYITFISRYATSVGGSHTHTHSRTTGTSFKLPKSLRGPKKVLLMLKSVIISCLIPRIFMQFSPARFGTRFRTFETFFYDFYCMRIVIKFMAEGLHRLSDFLTVLATQRSSCSVVRYASWFLQMTLLKCELSWDWSGENVCFFYQTINWIVFMNFYAAFSIKLTALSR